MRAELAMAARLRFAIGSLPLIRPRGGRLQDFAAAYSLKLSLTLVPLSSTVAEQPETVIAAAIAPQRIRFFFLSITPVGLLFEYSCSISGTDGRTLKKACETWGGNRVDKI